MPIFFLLGFLAIIGMAIVLYLGIALLACWLLQRKTSKNANMHGFMAAIIPFLATMAIGVIIDNPFSSSSPETSGDIFFMLIIPSVLGLLASPLICVFFCKRLAKRARCEEKSER